MKSEAIATGSTYFISCCHSLGELNDVAICEVAERELRLGKSYLGKS